jgi:hypothetical protein
MIIIWRAAIMAIPSVGLFIVLPVSHALVTVLQTLEFFLRTIE